MPDIVDFPGGIPRGDRTDPQLIANNRSGGMSINGFEQVIGSLSQRWEWSISFPIFKPYHMRGMRAFLAETQGRFNYVRIRLCDLYRMNRIEMGAIPGITGNYSVPHSDGAYFSDGSGYHVAGGMTPISGAIAEGATSMMIDPGFRIIPGTFFSINEWLYVIRRIDDPVEGDPDTMRMIHFSPPLREPASSEDEINFDAVCIWRMATDREGTANLRAGKFGSVTLNFVEPVGR